ncbi:pyridoxal phosphate-dependent aminotransferase [Anaeropeptidivorans aminofermentans]|uniref:pyridoxal phosphate-dependent aminotransferase n=1 Tax=Anaeropeptidivorans aminofermentans TaxID=2934315 RepID=UPI0020253E9F|nr:aminotransferase class I/II-fold pyridoxal phosphate-dependent enzyme [Anaeropeptidivorans aminofermentans]MBE6011753.1 aminotransferase class I/II-fold pyridoxal phosphate-dependent enzyme [Lachnospiraceae bacterium]
MQEKNYISNKVKEMPFSGIRKFFDVAAEMEGVISLGVGEPDFDTPINIRKKAIESIEEGKTTYTSNLGTKELRKEISRYLKERFQLEYDSKDQVIVTVGASEGIDIALRALIDPGDEVLYHEPCYVSYMPCIVMAGGVPVPIVTRNENQFRLTPEDLEKAITPKTKVLLLNYPNNPTGAIMEKEDLEKIADILVKNDILVITDEIYSELTYGGRKHVSIASLPGMYERTIVLNGFSKAFAMTGWRLGYAAGPKEIISAMTKIHQYVIMCAPTMSQYAGLEALKNSMDSVEQMRLEYDERRQYVVERFRAIGMDCFEPLGAFYVFPSIEKSKMTSDEFCEKLLFTKKVAIVPGTAFGACGEGFVRVSYAYSMEELKNAIDIIEQFMAEING